MLTSSVKYALPAGLALLASVAGQSYEEYNLTPDGYWHNRYHAILSMAAYGDYEELCPEQTFTEEAKLRNFPDSTRAPWTVVSTFGPTASGCEGFTAIIPEMNKALIIFKGDYDIEQNLDQTSTSWAALNLSDACGDCTVNAEAARAYMECKEETNNFEAIREQYYNSGLVFSITGHGFGGMLSQIASVDFNVQNIAYYSHAYGSPRVFNAAGAQFYNDRFNGEAGVRGISADDQYTEYIPEGPDYAHAGTPFYYSGWNNTADGPAWDICWLEDGLGYYNCLPRSGETGGVTLTPDQSHYYYFTSVGNCGGTRPNVTAINAFLNNPEDNSTPLFPPTPQTPGRSASVPPAYQATPTGY